MAETVTMRQIPRLTLDPGNLGLQFDAVMQETHGQRLQVTENPVETGVSISDHCYVEGATLSLVASIADIRMPSAAAGYDSPSGRSNYGYQRLCEIERQLARNELQPFEIITSVKTYDHMVLTEISMTRDKTTPQLGRFNMNFREVITVDTARTTYVREPGRVRRSASPTKDGGSQQPGTPTDQEAATGKREGSILSHLTGWRQGRFGGGRG